MENQLTIIENHWLPDCTWEGGWDRRAGRYYVWWWSMWIPLKPFGRGSLFHTFSTYLLGRTFRNNRCLSVSVSPIHLGCVFTEPLPMNSTVWTPILGDSVLYCWYTFIFPGFISKSLAVNRIAYSTPRCFLNGYPKVCQAGSVPKVVGENLHPQVCWSFLLKLSLPKRKRKTLLLSFPIFLKSSSFDIFWLFSLVCLKMINPKTKRTGPHLQRHGRVALDELGSARLPLPGGFGDGIDVFWGKKCILCSKTWIEWILMDFTCPMDA